MPSWRTRASRARYGRSTRRRRRTRRRRWLVLVLVAVVAWLGASAVLLALAAERAPEAWLTVNTNNPAGDLYARLGFEHRGKRARFTTAG